MSWHLTIISQGVILFTASTDSRQEIKDLAAEARRLRPDVKISIRHRGATPRGDPRQLELDLEPEPPLRTTRPSSRGLVTFLDDC